MQGCPLGGIAFAVTIHEIVLEIQHEIPELDLNIWFFDDSNIMGKATDLLKAYEIIKTRGPSVGFFMRPDKSILLSPSSNYNILKIFPAEIQRELNGGTDIMKSPIGTREFCENYILKKIKKLKLTIDNIAENLTDYPLMALQLLEYCAGFPRIGYVLNTTPSQDIKDAIKEFDTYMHSAIERIINCSISNLERFELSLPRLKGGLNLPIAAEIADSAYLGSLSKTQKLRNIILKRQETFVSQPFIDTLERYNRDNTKDLTPQLILAFLKPQYSLSHIVHEKIRSIVFNSYDTTGKARFNSISNQYSSAWTSIINNNNECTPLNAAQIRLLLLFRLGKPVFSLETDCNACSGKRSDRKGHHEVVCAGFNKTKSRHDRLRDEIYKIASRAGLLPIKEPNNILSPINGTNDKPADVLIPEYQNNKPCCFDIVISSPFTHVQKCSEEPGYHMKAAEKRKCDLYQERCQQVNHDFSAFAMDVFGGMSSSCHALVKRLAIALADKENAPVWLKSAHIRQRLVSSVQKGVALALQSRSTF